MSGYRDYPVFPLVSRSIGHDWGTGDRSGLVLDENGASEYLRSCEVRAATTMLTACTYWIVACGQDGSGHETGE